MPLDLAAFRDRLLIAGGDTRGELIARGWTQLNDCEAANLEKPDWVRDIADAFLDAGAEILVTNTDAANPATVAQRPETKDRSPERIADIARRGAEICRLAASEFPAKDRFVVGAVGPVQSLLMLEEITEDQLVAAYDIQIKALAAGGVDAILCRGFTELAALQCAIRAARSTKLPVIATMAFDAGADQTETTLGVTIPQMCEVFVKQPSPVGQVSLPARSPMSASNLIALGCDGSESPDTAAKVVALFRQASKLPIWIAIDAGLPQLIDGRAAYPEIPEDFAARLKPLAAAGANILAARHGATPAHLAALVKAQQPPKRRR